MTWRRITELEYEELKEAKGWAAIHHPHISTQMLSAFEDGFKQGWEKLQAILEEAKILTYDKEIKDD